VSNTFHLFTDSFHYLFSDRIHNHVSGVRGAIFRGFTTREEAEGEFDRALIRGDVAQVV
jgi:hypothetical protein